ncbi:hypothetical protein [Chondromyces apiculatus]|uniref:Alpha/beta hydrolase n=1 Tax=Chondromyces apiculatus DSM 436 TaxID=1192034 RepID=A0A017SY35_9BACT|nr:hypothetical protein [Chondromyces apiculatus]EYF01899.1 Hypothetical protein CAP_7667 [Chondromyces apiculatus DSM 436]
MVSAAIGAASYLVIDRVLQFPRTRKASKRAVGVLWLGPVSLADARAATIEGIPLRVLSCTGDGKPSCRQQAESFRTGDGRVLPSLRRRAGLPEGPLLVCAFSAGGSFVKELLRHPADRAELAGLLLADATYTTEVDAQGKAKPLEIFATFAREAAMSGRLFVVTASSAPNVSVEKKGVVYPSAAATMEAMRPAIAPDNLWSRWGGTENLAGPFSGVQLGSSLVWLMNYAGQHAHAEHATKLAPQLMRHLVAPALT